MAGVKDYMWQAQAEAEAEGKLELETGAVSGK